MRKNSSKTSKKPSANGARKASARSLNGPTKAKSSLTTWSSESESSKTAKTNSTVSSWKDDAELRAILQRAIDSMQQGDYEAAIRSYRKAIRRSPKCSMAYWLLGGVYHTFLHDSKTALPFFKMAVKLSPRTEPASLGLFHALWATDQMDAALEEIKRYQLLTNWSCQDYLEIVDEIKEKWLDRPKSKTQTKKKKVTP